MVSHTDYRNNRFVYINYIKNTDKTDNSRLWNNTWICSTKKGQKLQIWQKMTIFDYEIIYECALSKRVKNYKFDKKWQDSIMK